MNKEESNLEFVNFSSSNLALRHENHARRAYFKPYMTLCSLHTAIGYVGC
jgi:hypothetical protein